MIVIKLSFGFELVVLVGTAEKMVGDGFSEGLLRFMVVGLGESVKTGAGWVVVVVGSGAGAGAGLDEGAGRGSGEEVGKGSIEEVGKGSGEEVGRGSGEEVGKTTMVEVVVLC